MSQASTLVEFKDVGKSYDGKTLAVSGINLSIQEGEFITLLGPSGSGKSTTLMMLAGFEGPTLGTISYDGQELSSIPAHKRNFGMVFQNYALFPHMSVLENISFPLLMRKVSKVEAEERAKKALSMVQLEIMADRKPSQLSGGQQQRIALARALVFEPNIILLDEPLGALDKKLREEMQIELKHLHEHLGVTFVFVTHDQDEALTMSDRIAVFGEGSIQQIASPTEIYENPSNSFVANFIGETNMLEGVVTEVNSGTVTVKLTSNEVIYAKNTGDLSVGDKSKISVRPERLKLEKDSESSQQQAVEGHFVETIYHGSHASMKFDLACGKMISVRLPASDAESWDRNLQPAKIYFSLAHASAFEAH